jgi:hypothetical protein
MTPEKKKSKRNKNKFYVLRKGIKPGIYNTYDEALRYKYTDDKVSDTHQLSDVPSHQCTFE